MIRFLEIRNVDGKSVGEMTPAEATEIRKRLADAGISVRSVGSPFGKYDVEQDFGPHFDIFRAGLETANALGAEYIRMFSFFVPAGNAGKYKDEVMRRLGLFAREAEGAGIVLCHENEKGIYGDVPERCAEIHREIPGIKAVFDPANFVQCGVDTLKAWIILGPYVEYMHIKDAKYGGKVVPAGCGDGNVRELLRGFSSGMLTVEPHLTVFDGLAALEKDGGSASVNNGVFATADEAFDCAVNSLKALINEKAEEEVRK